MLDSNDDDFTGIYFLNAIRALPIFPLGPNVPRSERYSLKPLAQGRRPNEEEAPEFDDTIMEYITAVASSKEAALDNRTFDSELQKMMKKAKGKAA